MKRVIVTGANGFIGSALVRRLVDEGIRVVSVDISFAQSNLPDSPLLTCVESPIDEYLSSKIPQGEYDAFYHFAWRGVNGAEKSDPLIQNQNITMAIHAANTAHELGCKKFLLAGTVAENAVYSLPNMAKTSGNMLYGAAKHACHILLETYCKNIELPMIWMQFSNIYGVGNRTGNLISYTLSKLLEGKEATFGPAEQPYDFIYVDDLIEAVYRLGAKDVKMGKYFIGSGHPRILKEYLIRIGELVDCPDKIKIGVREDDGVRYQMNMFDISSLNTLGLKDGVSFDNGVLRMIDYLQKR